jgi:hypothetical protein
MRFRILAATLACLAVLASGFATVAAATPMGMPMSDDSATTAPCSHCPDCPGMPHGMPCPMPAADCLQAAVSAAPALFIASFELPPIGYAEIAWPVRLSSLTGLSQPPDPFPPRA